MNIKELKSVEGNEVKEKKHRLIITLTAEEHALLKKFSEATGRPMAADFMCVVRELFVFKFMEGVLGTYGSLVKVVGPLKNKAREMVKNIISVKS